MAPSVGPQSLVGKFSTAWGKEGTYRALVSLCPLLALQAGGELLVRAVGHLLHQLQPLLHLWTEQWGTSLGEGRVKSGITGLDNMGEHLTHVSAESRTAGETIPDSGGLEGEGTQTSGLTANSAMK